MTPTPAFKEWQVIVDALGAGAQTIILRKGGIAEGRGGFAVAAERFWLFPTAFHAQREKTKPAAETYTINPAEDTADATVTVRYYAELVANSFVSEWDKVAALDGYHLWTEATVRERFDWSRPPGLHVLVVRMHRLIQPVTLPRSPAMSGCKSWIELPLAFHEHPAELVLDEPTFAHLRPDSPARAPFSA